MNLTDLTIRSLSPPPTGQRDYFDDALPGFGVRIGQGGTRSFFLFTGKTKNRERRSIGRWGIITLAQARAEAKRILAERTLGRAKPRTMTFSSGLKLYEEQRYPSLRARTQRDYKGTLARHFTKKLGDYRLADIDFDTVTTIAAARGTGSRAGWQVEGKKRGRPAHGTPLSGIKSSAEEHRALSCSPT